MRRIDGIDFEVVGGEDVEDEVRDTVIELVAAGLKDSTACQIVLVAAANLIGNRARAAADVEAALAAMRRLATRAHVSLEGGGEA